jgi:hypothetical protein
MRNLVTGWTMLLRHGVPGTFNMERERNRAVACTTPRCQALHLSVLDVSALPQGHHGCLKYPGIRKQSEQGDELGVFVLCCHLFRHYVDLVGSLDGGQVGEPTEALPKRCVPPDDLNKTRHTFECRIRVGLHVHPVSERRKLSHRRLAT